MFSGVLSYMTQTLQQFNQSSNEIYNNSSSDPTANPADKKEEDSTTKLHATVAQSNSNVSPNDGNKSLDNSSDPILPPQQQLDAHSEKQQPQPLAQFKNNEENRDSNSDVNAAAQAQQAGNIKFSRSQSDNPIHSNSSIVNDNEAATQADYLHFYNLMQAQRQAYLNSLKSFSTDPNTVLNKSIQMPLSRVKSIPITASTVNRATQPHLENMVIHPVASMLPLSQAATLGSTVPVAPVINAEAGNQIITLQTYTPNNKDNNNKTADQSPNSPSAAIQFNLPSIVQPASITAGNETDAPIASSTASATNNNITENNAQTTSSAVNIALLTPRHSQTNSVGPISPLAAPFATTLASPRSKSSSLSPNINISYAESAVNIAEPTPKTRKSVKIANYQRILDEETADLAVLAKLSWNGVPAEYRYVVWPLLLGYLPANRARRADVLAKRRLEYRNNVRAHYDLSNDEKSAAELEALHQIQQDIPRTSGNIKFFKLPDIQLSLERILYIFAVRHPASSYVQGMNDLLTAFCTVFFTGLRPDLDIFLIETNPLSEAELQQWEADSYWCLSLLIESIQDNYTFAQPGIQQLVHRLSELTQKVDSDLAKHLEEENIPFLHFAFRWMNCLLMREFNLTLILRLFDTYCAELCNKASSLSNFHLYVCLAFLIKFTTQLKTMGFSDLIIFLQKLPTGNWAESDLELILSQAFIYQSLYQNSGL
jgi:hypothetical protein